MRPLAQSAIFRKAYLQDLRYFSPPRVYREPSSPLHHQYAASKRAASLLYRPWQKEKPASPEIQLQRLRTLNDSLVMTTILTDRPEETTVNQIVSQLPQLRHLQRRDGLALDVVFLLTPSFTSWVDLRHKFLPAALRHMYKDAGADLRIFRVHSVAAIVDAIPSPGSDQNLGTFTAGHEGVALLVTSRGSNTQQHFTSAIQNFRAEEGENALISFKFWREHARSLARSGEETSQGRPRHSKSVASKAAAVETDVFTEQNPPLGNERESEVRTSPRINSESDLNFERFGQPAEQSRVTEEGSPRKTDDAIAKDAEMVFSLTSTEQYDLPLTNTVFQNGRKFTMYKDMWDFEFDASEQEWNFKPTRSAGLPQREEQSHLTVSAIPDSSYHRLPLISLTKPREVVSAVGNVISLLSGDSEKDAYLPASSELEKDIPAFIEQQDIAPGAQVQVYALVTPKHRRSTLQLPLEDCIRERESRLHRVTGGGGGWGKKAGLLSLAPEISLSPQDALGTNRVDILAAGDEIQFFVAVSPRSSAAEQQEIFREGYEAMRDTTRSLSASPRAGDIVLGTIPPKDDPQYKKISLLGHIASAKGQLAVFPGFFGMLTERSMCMGHSALDLQLDENSRLDLVRNSSIIGMPFASVAVRTKSPLSGSGSLERETVSPSKTLQSYLKRDKRDKRDGLSERNYYRETSESEFDFSKRTDLEFLGPMSLVSRRTLEEFWGIAGTISWSEWRHQRKQLKRMRQIKSINLTKENLEEWQAILTEMKSQFPDRQVQEDLRTIKKRLTELHEVLDAPEWKTVPLRKSDRYSDLE